MKIRHSTELDFERMMEIYSFARKYMAEHGNPNQWVRRTGRRRL